MKLRERERSSIEAFLQEHADKLNGRVLDFGCGHQPYRQLVKNEGGTYTGHDGQSFPGSVVVENVGPSWSQISLRTYDTVMMTQVWQYMEPHVLESLLSDFASGVALKPGGSRWIVPAERKSRHPHSTRRTTALRSSICFALTRSTIPKQSSSTARAAS